MRFSRRTDWNTDLTPLARSLADRRSRSLPLVDLTASNPTRAGIQYPDDLLHPLQSAEVLDYDPDPRGKLRARQAVAAYYAQRHAVVDPSRIVLTTGTSEAYSFLFRMLCDPGDEILVPVPGYPLFDYLADAESVRLVPTPLLYDHGWQLDLAALEQAITPRTRAIILVHPNNPTGHFTTQAESDSLFAICLRHRLSIIVDEVFLDYPLEAATESPDHLSFLARSAPVPAFVVSGISKILGLPQMKLSWIAGLEAREGSSVRATLPLTRAAFRVRCDTVCCPAFAHNRHVRWVNSARHSARGQNRRARCPWDQMRFHENCPLGTSRNGEERPGYGGGSRRVVPRVWAALVEVNSRVQLAMSTSMIESIPIHQR